MAANASQTGGMASDPLSLLRDAVAMASTPRPVRDRALRRPPAPDDLGAAVVALDAAGAALVQQVAAAAQSISSTINPLTPWGRAVVTHSSLVATLATGVTRTVDLRGRWVADRQPAERVPLARLLARIVADPGQAHLPSVPCRRLRVSSGDALLARLTEMTPSDVLVGRRAAATAHGAVARLDCTTRAGVEAVARASAVGHVAWLLAATDVGRAAWVRRHASRERRAVRALLETVIRDVVVRDVVAVDAMP